MSFRAGMEALLCMETVPYVEGQMTWACCFSLSPNQVGFCQLLYWEGFCQGQQLFTFYQIPITFKADNNDLKPDSGLNSENPKMC